MFTFAILILLVIVIKFGIKRFEKSISYWCIILITGILPVMANAVYSCTRYTNGFQLFDLEKEYGIRAVATCFVTNAVFWFPVSLYCVVVIIISVIQLRKIKISS